MKLLDLLLMLATITTTLGNRDKRFIGGTQAKSTQFPYLVSIRLMEDGKHICGGSIIHEKYILTAAHCLKQKTKDDFYIVAGSNVLDYFRKKYLVESFKLQGSYDDQKVINDIALIKVKKTIKFSRQIQKIALPAVDSEPPTGSTLSIAGFGRTIPYFYILNNQLMHANVTTISLKECRHRLRHVNLKVTNKHICTFDDSKGFCKGDSGGPLVYEGQQVGIVSWMVSRCAQGYPNVYVKVSNYMNWIERTIKKMDKQKSETAKCNCQQIEESTASMSTAVS